MEEGQEKGRLGDANGEAVFLVVFFFFFRYSYWTENDYDGIGGCVVLVGFRWLFSSISRMKY